jgi:hypothetical protein
MCINVYDQYVLKLLKFDHFMSLTKKKKNCNLLIKNIISREWNFFFFVDQMMVEFR